MSEPNPIRLDVKLTGYAKKTDGGVRLSFDVHPHTMQEEIEKTQINDLFAMLLQPVDENDSPVEWKRRGKSAPRESADISRESSVTATEVFDKAPAAEPGRGFSPEKRLVRQAAICCEDSLFRIWLAGGDGEPLTEEEAAEFVRKWCKVKSRAAILAGTEAELLWRDLYGQFITWKHAA